ncbi:DUF2007 domain-containing protein [Pacificimonas flava]|uniref:DUF2007 domain-containing protein n=1 Tax=Pacificimonas flava TaxID=1234595 RepID=M2U5X4_9SPHN|nr:DUF2007 domain-containing protein [Pacificimonas flava]EMD83393.1 hypothetical protein C725_1294 [Pacificimonas flava]MBB5279045.1 hypothetical protein [Pacificimonas flava]
MIEIAVFYAPVEADLARARLASAGIESLLLDHNLSGLLGGALMPSRLMVHPDDEADAKAVLEI